MNKEVEIRCLATELRANPTEGRTITGYAAKFDSWSEPIMRWLASPSSSAPRQSERARLRSTCRQFKEKIERDAFEDCDVEDVIMCFNHNPDTILARTISDTFTLSTDDIGLRFSFTAPNTTLGNDMLELVSRGDISQCSFRFTVESDEWRYADKDNGLEYDERTILKFGVLKDVSLVIFPAYKDTEASVRHLEERKAEFFKPKDEPKEEHTPEPINTSHRTRTTQFLKLKR